MLFLCMHVLWDLGCSMNGRQLIMSITLGCGIITLGYACSKYFVQVGRSMTGRDYLVASITLLSSITVLRDSIHIGSTSPSRTIHFGDSLGLYARSRMILEYKPGGGGEKR